MSEKKVYAVRKGRETGLFYSWPACQEQIKGYSGAEYKSFKTGQEASAYLAGGTSSAQLASIAMIEPTPDTMLAYVDGSYNVATKEYSAGVVVLWQCKEVTFSEKADDPRLKGMRNVAGEIMGAQIAMKYALEQQAKSVIIYHDYEGVEKWCTKAWEAKQDGTKQYKAYYEQAAQQLDIRFVKVKAHSGDQYNEQADRLAKDALGLK
ncbi:MAG: viroplasmin family protein [Sporomusaceae bacterium]|nr:viroplasmin family protein [Sporomusaceae bacterium]